MDKLRALQYFVAAAEAGSFSGAARHLEVSVPAVGKMINALERAMGTTLVERNSRGLVVTADGRAYLDACRPLLEQLEAADAVISRAGARPKGTLVVGAPGFVIQHWLVPAMPAFFASYPDIQVDFRVLTRLADAEPRGADVTLVLGWPLATGLVHRVLARTRVFASASPEYWAMHGFPKHPRDLQRHNCLCMRNPEGTVLDLWEFAKAGRQESVAVKGNLVSDDRNVIVDAALAGMGVARLMSLTLKEHTRDGRLVSALLDWEMAHAPPINLFYRPGFRRNPRVRPFVDFLGEHFGSLAGEKVTGAAAPAEPPWYRVGTGRASAAKR
ncbi:MAG: LysR family transcriptional regulator [Betaproteobacteria bacterium]|nr:LysR family transcriptional regulator [Betaproteobacteria bacterium]